MKYWLIGLTLIAQIVSASEQLLLCTKTTFRDLKQISITKEDNKIFVTEIDENNQPYTYQIKEKSWDDKTIELSDWYGYTRILKFSYGSWSLEHFDECSGGISSITCN